MSQRHMVESQTQSNPSLKPVLKTALVTLDVQIDEELARYRRSRSGLQMPSGRMGHSARSRKPLESVPARETKGTSAGGVTTTLPATSFVPTSQSLQEEQTDHLDTPTTSSSLALAKATAPDETAASLAPAPVKSGGILDTATDRVGPDDYLESSEALLRSLAEEQPQHQTEHNFSESLLTPLGVGSMLLLLLASATLGYVVMNPATLTALWLDRFGKHSPTIANSPELTNATSANVETSPLPDSPNLAEREFVDLDLNNLSSVKPTSNRPSVVPLPTAKATVSPLQPSETGSNRPATSVPPQIQMQPIGAGLNAPTSRAPSPPSRYRQHITAPRQPQLSGQPAPQSYVLPSSSTKQSVKQSSIAPTQEATPGHHYYVVANYKSDRNLELARQVVADAYVDTSSQGTLIHLGAVESKAQAQKLAEELQRKGIQARIYRP